jgi:hypothetical protein
MVNGILSNGKYLKILPVMKSKIKILTLILLLTTSCTILSRQTEAQSSNVSIQVFYDELSPYGQWIDYANYGYVWIPNVESGFVPYSTDGYWIMTNYGWTWASNYNWGWAAFHYGRWSFNDSFGWFWVPGNEWGPAWVNWRQADGYYGWEPMEPGMSIDESFGSQYNRNDDHWMFVSYRDFDRRNINQYYVNNSDRNRIVRNSVVINNTYNDNTRHTRYVTGPSRNEVENITGRRIVPLTVQNNNRPGKEINNGRFQIYRPQIETINNGRKPSPTRVTNQNNINQRPARDASTQPTRQPNMNNTTPIQQRNDNGRRNTNVTPTNQDRRIQTVDPSKTNPVEQNKPVRQPNVVNPQNNNTTPIQQRNDNNQINRQPNVVPLQNNNAQPIRDQQRNVNPQNNDNANPLPANVQNKVQPAQPRNRSSVKVQKTAVRKQQIMKQQVKKEQNKIPADVTPKRQ